MKMIERKLYLDFLKKLKDKKIIKVVTGIRRCGKSTLFTLYKEYLLKNNVDKNQIISLNFENPNDNNFTDWRELYNFIKEKLNLYKMNYIFLDEIQNIENFEKVVDGLFVQENVDLYITGSNSYMLSGELATYLTGRYMQIHMLPLSFKEYLSIHNSFEEMKEYQNYIENGGFPYLITLDNDQELIRNYLDGIYNTVLMKDVIFRNNIKDVLILESVVKFIFDNIGQLVSTNKISNVLNSLKRKNSVNTIESYLTNLIDSYIIYKVSRFDIKGKEYLKTGDKYYVCDLGLRKYLLGEIKDLESILENVIFLELKRRNYEIYIGKIDKSEVDFVVKNNDGIKYIQVSLSVRDENTLNRELKALEAIKDNYPKYIITLDYDNANYNGIRQINAIDFLLGRVDI
ncbi:MAG: ATP-binding protein [Firmicutes bacterium]|nr:ATP-binding protein [Bacillota bacterium]